MRKGKYFRYKEKSYGDYDHFRKKKIAAISKAFGENRNNKGKKQLFLK